MNEPATAASLALERLGPYLEDHLPGFSGLRSATKFAGGQSNPTFLLEAASGRYVLRRKPPGTLLKSAHAVDREYRVMKALGPTPVPVPPVLHLAEDETVIGTMFFVMGHVEGRIFWDPRLPDLTPERRGAIYDAMNRALTDLHKVDPDKVGLSDFGKPGSYFARQTDRWTKQYRASETETISEMDALIDWLEGHQPPDDGRVAIVHGDYRIDNMIFASGEERILAILDWELSTLGHPHADLAYQCMQWRLPNEGALRGLGDIDRRAHGLPSEEDYVALYCARMGIDGIPHWSFCLAFSFFRIAAILQGVYKRALEGNASDPERGRRMGAAVPVLAAMALATIEETAP